MHFSLRDKFAGLAELPLNLESDVRVETETVVVKDAQGSKGGYCKPGTGGMSDAKKKGKPSATRFD